MPTRKTKVVALTEKRIQDLAAPATGRITVYDANVPGLIVRVTASGAKSFSVFKKLAGRPVRVHIGSTSETTLAEARTAAKEIVAAIAKGVDPGAARRQAKQEPTLKDLWAHYLEFHAKPRKKSWPDDERQYNKYLAAWHNKRLSAIRPADVEKWHGRMAKDHGPIQANRTLALLSTMLNKAGGGVGWAGPNPCQPVANFPERSRERFLAPAEIGAFFTALAAEDPFWQAFFLLCLFTGARRGNIASMAWAEIDLEHGVWHLPGNKSKNKRPASIALCPPALAILRKRKEQANGSPWVFPSGRNDGHLVDPRKAWNRILAAMRQCPHCNAVVGAKPKTCPKCKKALPAPEPIDLHMHDLRRTQGSWQAAMGISLAIIGKSLGHVDLKSTQIYSRLQIDPVRDAVGRTATALLTAGKIELSPEGTVKLLETTAEPVEDADDGDATSS